jgi:hypothetical protein
MSERRLPVRPDLKQLRNQAKDLLRAIHANDENALADLRQHHPHPPEPLRAKLALSITQISLAPSLGHSRGGSGSVSASRPTRSSTPDRRRFSCPGIRPSSRPRG